MQPIIRNILQHYKADSPGIIANLAKILMHGQLGGTGRMIILPVDQGFEHGPDRSFAMNQPAYDPLYHAELAIEAKLNALAAPLGLLQIVANNFIGEIPTILKLNHASSLTPSDCAPDQARLATVQDAVYLGCSAVGFTIYPGSSNYYAMLNELREIVQEAREYSLPVVVWSYPRGSELDNKQATALDVCAYSAHMAALAGAHIIKVKLPAKNIALENTPAIEVGDLAARVQHVTQACLAGKRLVVFSGGNSKDSDDLLAEAQAIHQGGGNGSIIGRNAFQRPKAEALQLLAKISNIYSS